MTSKNDKMTPSMPSRTSKLGLDNQGQIQMNRIIRKDIASKPPVDKSKVSLEKPKLLKQIDTPQNLLNPTNETIKKSTLNPSPLNANIENKRRSSHNLSLEIFAKDQKGLEKDKNLK